MAVLALGSRLVLAVVFAVAGLAKLADRTGTREAAFAFGASRALSGPLALLLPLAELAAVGLLLPATTAAAGAVVALALLLLFSGAIATSLTRGRAPECHCFGQLHSAPASWTTLARNAALAGVAALALVGPERSAVAWIGRLDGAETAVLAVGVATACVLVAGAAAFVSLLRSYGKVLVRLDRVEEALADVGIEVAEPVEIPELGLAPGTPVPEHAGLDSLLERDLPILLLFTSPDCGPCQALLPRAAAWQAEHGHVLTVAFASDGDEDAQVEHVLADQDLRLYRGFQANGTPCAVLIAPDGTVDSWLASGADEIERLLERALVPEPGLRIGSEVPELALPSLEGEQVSFAELTGRETLLLFWNPGCGFCRSMHEELLEWEAGTNGHGPRLVVLSSGDADSTRAEGFRSQVLLDDEFVAGSAFGAGGTPMAVLLGADGRVASRVAAGADAVLALARS